MSHAIHRKAVVQKGGILRLRDLSIPTGKAVEVTVEVKDDKASLPPLTSYWGAARGLFATPEEVETFIRGERESWE